MFSTSWTLCKSHFIFLKDLFIYFGGGRTEGASYKGTMQEHFSLKEATKTPAQGEGQDKLFKAGSPKHPESQATPVSFFWKRSHKKVIFQDSQTMPLPLGAAWPHSG